MKYYNSLLFFSLGILIFISHVNTQEISQALTDEDRTLLLHYWVIEGNLNQVQQLIAERVSLNTQHPDGNQMTPLMWAALRTPEMVHYLVEHGANINLLDKRGENALFYVADNRNQDKGIAIAAYLLLKGIDATVQNRYGRTAFEEALLKDNIKVAKAIYTFMKDKPDLERVRLVLSRSQNNSPEAQAFLSSNREIIQIETERIIQQIRIARLVCPGLFRGIGYTEISKGTRKGFCDINE